MHQRVEGTDSHKAVKNYMQLTSDPVMHVHTCMQNLNLYE